MSDKPSKPDTELDAAALGKVTGGAEINTNPAPSTSVGQMPTVQTSTSSRQTTNNSFGTKIAGRRHQSATNCLWAHVGLTLQHQGHRPAHFRSRERST